MLTQEILKELLHYDPESGLFTWIKNVGPRALEGNRAGHRKSGYVQIGLLGRTYFAHRLAWLYKTGRWPKDQIDHKDRVRNNNKWSNLREANRAENSQNSSLYKSNSVGLKGVSFFRPRGTWRARIDLNGVQHELGYFRCPAAAHFAYVVASEKMHGEFSSPDGK